MVDIHPPAKHPPIVFPQMQVTKHKKQFTIQSDGIRKYALGLHFALSSILINFINGSKHLS